ncbi:MAG: hypothetical protein IT313_07100 [Anaerolineales bacterium]|nr:hypothetical protein [Anaerolineales bacterium]
MPKSKHARTVALILILALALRWGLILQGGQYFFSDEERYETSRAFARLVMEGSPGNAFSQLFSAPEHLGFKIIGLMPAFLEQFTRASLALPALFFSLFSALNLYLIYRIARRAGASEKEALTALILAAASMSLLYFSRHLVPYDTAMTFGLLAVYAALAEKSEIKTALGCGALAFACFIVYNGYWALAFLGILIHVFRQNNGFGALTRKGLFAAAGFMLPASLLFILAALAGTDLLTEYRSFSATVSQGQFDEGWSLPFEYFWRSEHWLFILLVLLSAIAVLSSRGNDKTVTLWASAAVFIYLCLLIPSVFLHSFVVYGRLARQALPCLILLSAGGFEQLKQSFSLNDKLQKALLVAVIVQAAWNYHASFALVYPREFARQAQTLRPEFVFSEKRLAFGAPTLCQNNGYIAAYVKRFEVPPEPNPPLTGQILLSAPHPDNFLPYQYEGYTDAQRQYLRELNPKMQFYKAADAFMSDLNPVWRTMKNCNIGAE